MGAAAAIRAAREGANIVGVDWLGDLGAATVDRIKAEGGNAVFVEGDIGEEDTSSRMIETAVKTFGKIRPCAQQCGRYGRGLSGDPVDYFAQKDRVFARLHDQPISIGKG